MNSSIASVQPHPSLPHLDSESDWTKRPVDQPTSPARWRALDPERSALPDVLCGLDTVGNGTWFGINAVGQVGILTNYTEPPPDTPYRSTRGSLVSNYLSSNPRVSPSTYLSTLVPTFDADTDIYAGFNLLLFDLFPSDGSDPAARYFSNRLELDALRPSARPAGVDGLSNSVIDQPWEKVKQVRAALDKLLEEEKDIGGEWGDHRWFDNLRDLMSPCVPTVDRSTFKQSITIPPVLLPPGPTVPPRWYATRLLTMLLVTHDGRYHFVEEDVHVLADHPDDPPEKATDSRRTFEGWIKRNDIV